MKETTKQNLAIFAITALFAGSFLVFFNLINPLIKDEKDIRLKIKETEVKIEKLEKYKATSENLIKTYLNLGDKINTINLALPSSSETSQILAIVDKLNNDYNITVTNISFDEGTKDDYGYLVIHLNFSTTYEIFKNWLKEIENELRLMDIDKLTITAGRESVVIVPTTVTTVGSSKTTARTTKSTGAATTTTTTTKLPTAVYSPRLNFDVTLKAYYYNASSLGQNEATVSRNTPSQ